ncbi:MAG: hypothetical protein OQK51_16520 [Kangiellaceae bacterium]|nr:hypothetical protein [Kangiellaceae bacterium]
MNLEQLAKEDWNEIGSSVYLSTFNLYPQDVESNYGIVFFQYVEEGLGLQNASVVKIDGVIYLLYAAADESGTIGSIIDDNDSNNENREALKVSVNVLSYCQDSKVALDLICEALSINVTELYNYNENLGRAKWQLSRLDDNGNEEVMFVFLDENCANLVRDRYEKKGHKQHYYVNEI